MRDEAEARACTARLIEFGPWRTLGIPASRLFRDLTNPEREVFVAEFSENIAGVLILHSGGAFDAYIQLIAIFPEVQNRGFGKQLVQFAEEKSFCRTQNVFLCVSSFNAPAQKFYERLGYQRVGELENFLASGHSEILMRKTRGPLLGFVPQT